MRRLLERRERQAVGTGAQHQVEDPLRAAPRRELVEHVGRVAIGHQRACDGGGREIVEGVDVGVRPLPTEDRREP